MGRHIIILISLFLFLLADTTYEMTISLLLFANEVSALYVEYLHTKNKADIGMVITSTITSKIAFVVLIIMSFLPF